MRTYIFLVTFVLSLAGLTGLGLYLYNTLPTTATNTTTAPYTKQPGTNTVVEQAKTALPITINETTTITNIVYLEEETTVALYIQTPKETFDETYPEIRTTALTLTGQVASYDTTENCGSQSITILDGAVTKFYFIENDTPYRIMTLRDILCKSWVVSQF